MFQLAHYRWL